MSTISTGRFILALSIMTTALVSVTAAAQGPARYGNGYVRDRDVARAKARASCLRALQPLKPALIESPAGAKLHAQLTALIGSHADAIDRMVYSQNREVTFGLVTRRILEDRQRIKNGLKILLAGFAADSNYAEMLKKVLVHIDEPNECWGCEADYSRPMQEIMSSTEPKDSKIPKYLYQAWGSNRSFIAEVITALEVKGLIGTSLRISEIIPKKYRETIEKRFRQTNRQRDLDVEIDVITASADGLGYNWLEVKNPGHRIRSVEDSRLDSYFKKRDRINSILDFIRNDYALKDLMNTNVKLQFVIRGAGITDEAKADLLLSGILIQNTEPLPINQNFGP